MKTFKEFLLEDTDYKTKMNLLSNNARKWASDKTKNMRLAQQGNLKKRGRGMYKQTSNLHRDDIRQTMRDAFSGLKL